MTQLRLAMLLGVAACRPDGRGSNQPRLPACEQQPCAGEEAIASFGLQGNAGSAGYDLATDEQGRWLVFGSPGGYEPSATFVSLDTLTRTGRWREPSNDFIGGSVAVTDLGGDGVPDVAVGAFAEQTPELGGAVYLVQGAPDAAAVDLSQAALLAFRAPPRFSSIGTDCLFAALGPDEATELVVAGGGTISGFDGEQFVGGVYAIDPGLRGDLGPEDASRSLLSAEAGVAVSIAAWDGDGDGIEDLVAQHDVAEEVYRFASPWVGGLDPADATTTWSGDAPDALGLHDLVGLPDLTGDGLPELAMAAATRDVPSDRSGALYLVQGGDLEGGPAADLELQLAGTELGEGMGTAAAAGDVDGDGDPDLAVGAAGIYPGALTGKVLLFAGPLAAGPLVEEDAIAVLYGEREHDFFGGSLAMPDADRDGRADLVVGAQGADGGGGRVYVFDASALVP